MPEIFFGIAGLAKSHRLDSGLLENQKLMYKLDKILSISNSVFLNTSFFSDVVRRDEGIVIVALLEARICLQQRSAFGLKEA